MYHVLQVLHAEKFRTVGPGGRSSPVKAGGLGEPSALLLFFVLPDEALFPSGFADVFG